MQQGLEYATTLDIPFVFSSNGDGFVFHDRTGAGGATETNLTLDAFPSPDEMWARYAVTIGPNGLGDPPLRRRLEGEPQTLDDGRIDRMAQRLRRRRQRTGVAELGGYRRADAVLHPVPRRWHTLVGLRLGHLLCYIFHGHLLAFRPGPSWLRGCKHREGCAHLCLRSTRLHESRTADQPLRRAGGRWPCWCSRSHLTAPRPRTPAELKSAPGFLRYLFSTQ